MVKSRQLTFPSILIFVVEGIKQLAFGMYVELDSELSALVSLLLSITLFCAIGWWLKDDLRKRSESWFYCPGLILWIAWPVLLPFYLLKTRGRSALITIAIFAGIWVAASVLGVILGVLLT